MHSETLSFMHKGFVCNAVKNRKFYDCKVEKLNRTYVAQDSLEVLIIFRCIVDEHIKQCIINEIDPFT